MSSSSDEEAIRLIVAELSRHENLILSVESSLQEVHRHVLRLSEKIEGDFGASNPDSRKRRVGSHQLAARHDDAGYWKRRSQALEESFSFKLGKIFVDAVAAPGKNTLLLPFRIFRLVGAAFKLYWSRRTS